MISFAKDKASVEQIHDHFLTCDSHFQEQLRARVDLHLYTQKITEKAYRYEAWANDQLIALVAIYHNRDPQKMDFITSVSVSLGFQGQGLAQKLLQESIAFAQQTGAQGIRLEVSADNIAAQNLYKKNGFHPVADNIKFWSLQF